MADERNFLFPFTQKNKQEVGRRLAMAAEEKVYNLSVVGVGPHFESAQKQDASFTVPFSEVRTGLKINERLCWLAFKLLVPIIFSIGQKRRSSTKNSIKVSAKEVPEAVRYAWEDNLGDGNLINSANLPAFPFRTDQWK